MLVRASRSAVAVIATALALTLVAAACGGGSDSDSDDDAAPATSAGGNPEAAAIDAGTPVEGGTVTWGVEAETDGLNPVSGRFVVSGHLMASAIFDPLVSLDDEGQWEPYLAEAVTPNEEFTTWTITLREGVTFHDGTPLDADAVTSDLHAHQESAISKGAVYDIDTVETTGPLEVTITTKVPWPTLPYTLTSQIGYVPAPSMLDVPEEARTPVGTGPFKFQSWDFGTSFQASRYPDYWRTDDNGTQLPYLDAIEFRPILDPQQRSDSLLNGDIDILITPTFSEIARLSDSPGVELLTYSEGEETYITLNNAKAPFDNANARLAVAYATDSATLREQMGAEYAFEANSMWAPGQLGHREDAGQLAFDLEAAKAAVAAYTAETGQPLAFSLVASQSIEAQKLQQYLTQQWGAAGMEVGVQTLPQSELVVAFALGNYQAGQSRLFGFPEPDMDLFFLHSRSIDPALISFNIPRFANENVDAALETARSSTDENVRDEAYADVARVINENAPMVFLYRPSWAIAANESVHGYGQAANGTMQTLGPKTWISTLWKS